jgi:hypothetical protein
MADDYIGFICFKIGGTPTPTPTPTPSDSIEGIGETSALLLREPNWIQLPQGDFDFTREIQQYSGTTLEIYKLIDESISELTYLYSCMDKNDEYYFTNFFCQRKGRHKRFWLPYWKNPFSLQSDISSGDTILSIDNCYYNRLDYGNERIFIKLKSGVVLTRKVTAVIQDGDSEQIILNSSQPIDRNIKRSEIKFFSRLLLVRFNQDTMDIKYRSDSVSNITFKFRELPFEHSEDLS